MARRCLTSPLGIEPDVVQLQHEHVVCGCNTWAFGLDRTPVSVSGEVLTVVQRIASAV
jgi:hypothetical protein